MRNITIVHLSDIHVKEDRVSEFRKRVDALFSDLDELKVMPDFLVVSGDIAYSGKAEEYRIADKVLFAPFAERYKLQPDQVVLCMGNHDINRAKIDQLSKGGLLKQLEEATESPYDIPSDRFRNSVSSFCELAGKYSGDGSNTFGFVVEPIEGVNVGFASINSALTCFDEEKPCGMLHLTRMQVEKLTEGCKSCALRIGVMHHPIDWLSPLDKESNIPDILHEFQLILTGHLHRSNSQLEKTPTGENLFLAATSFFAGAVSPRDCKDGYNIYSIDPKRGQLVANYRMFIRERQEFDANVEHAKGGIWHQELPQKYFNRQDNLPVLRNAAGVADRLLVQMNDSLRSVQRIESPIYVEPPLVKVNACSSGSQPSEIKIRDCQLEDMAHLNFFYAPCDVGATSFFENFCVRVNRDENSKVLAVYLKAGDIKSVCDAKDLLSVVSSKYSVPRAELNLKNLCIVLDDVFFANSEQINILLEKVDEAGKVIIGVRNRVLFIALQKGLRVDDVAFFEFRYWGPEKIREFVGRYLEIQGVSLTHGVDAAINFVIKSFAGADIRMTPLLVGLYLRVFCKGANKISGVSFLELLQELETYGFAQVANTLTNTRYYYQRFLRRLAISCFESKSLTVDLRPLKREFSEMFLKAAIPDGIDTLLSALQETGIVIVNDQEISFSCFVFFWYYLSQCFLDDRSLLDRVISSDVNLIVAGGAIAYYAGNKRDGLDVIQDLISAMKRRRPQLLKVTLKDFEEYANQFLLPPDSKDVDAQMDELSSRSSSMLMTEEEFSKEKEIARKAPDKYFKYVPGKTVFADFDADAQILKTIYNSFRNLEVIASEEKEKILEEVLDYHLDGNFRIIKFFAEMLRGEGEHATSFVAYLIAIAGTALLSDNIASEQLCATLEKVYGKTSEPLKRFLIVCIMQALGVDSFSAKLVQLLEDTRSFALTELGYFMLQTDLVMYEGKHVPDHLRAAFKDVCTMRGRMHGHKRAEFCFSDEWNKVETLRLSNVRNQIARRVVD